MCGITGLVRAGKAVSQEELIRMMDLIRHRGPDADGHYIDKNVGLGHLRLTILDLSERANQPMFSHDGRYVMVYNGEVYNYLDIKKELELAGKSFQTTCDTEVILEAFVQWGLDSIPKLNGMFALVIYDIEARKLYCARDRFGIKPLYYAVNDAGFWFGSEVKPIVKHPDFRMDVDYEGLMEYFTFQNFFTDKTLYANVQLLEPGHTLVLSAENPTEFKKEMYWDFDFREPEKEGSLEEYIEEFDHLFTQAVKRNLMSDVPVGSYLSGGMDSGSITAVATQHLPWMHTFTCGFDLHSASGLEIRFDEREKAEHMSYLFKTEHYEMVLKAGDMERIMDKLVYHLEEPRVGQSYPNFYAAQLASKFVKVCLSGAGGDELFGGYPWRYYQAIANDNFDDYIDKYYVFWQRLIPNRHIQQVFAPVWDKVGHVWTRDIFKDVFRNRDMQGISTPEEYFNASLYLEAKTFLHGLLVVDDKLSMASGLEGRVPFLDNDLVDFAMRVPAKYKLGNLQEVVRMNENEDGNKRLKYFQKTNDGKLLMRKAMNKYIPREVTDRIKQGFSAPDASWFKGESIDYVRDAICTPKARIYDFMDYEATQSLVQEHLSGQQNRRLFIWSLLYFESWCKQFL